MFLWDARARRPIASFQDVVGAATSLRFSPDGRTLLVADARPDGSGALDLLAIPRLGLVHQAAVAPVIQMAFSRDGKILFSADRAGQVWLLDARTWQPIGTPLPGKRKPIRHRSQRPPPGHLLHRGRGATVGHPLRPPPRRHPPGNR